MSKREKRTARLFTIVQVVFCVAPLLNLAYLWLMAGAQGDFEAIISANPLITVAFLTAMIQPFVAYLVGYSAKLIKTERAQYAVLNLLLLFIAEALMRNLIGMIGTGLLFYQVLRSHAFSLKACFGENGAGAALRITGGALAVLPLAALCGFVLLQLG